MSLSGALRDVSLGKVILSALIAGVLAGLAAAAFNFIATEPVIDRAILLETLRHQAEGTYEEPMVSRELQKVGLFVGFVIYGLTWSLLFGSVFFAAQRKLPGETPFKRAAIMGAAALWGVALFPFLKYPANPPGVGDPGTITLRQTLYLTLLGVSIVGTALSIALVRLRGWRTGLPALAVFDVFVYLVLPGNPDAILTSPDILWTFRVLSAVGLTVFWAVLGLSFGWLLQRETKRVALRTRPSVA